MQHIIPSSLAIACCLGASASSSVRQTSEPDSIEEQVHGIVSKAIEDDEFEGLSIALAIRSDLVLERGWGVVADGLPAGVRRAFSAGALLEQWTRTALLSLVDDDLVELSDSAARLLDGLEGHEELRVEHLMAHTSGLPDYTEWPGIEVGVPDTAARVEILRRLSRTPLESTPGACFSFSPTDTLLLGWILEAVAEEPLQDVLERCVFEPAGMDSTSFEDGASVGRAAARTAQEVAGRIEWGPGGTQPFRADSLYSSTTDVFEWQRALLAGELLSEDGTEKVITSSRLTDGTLTHRGFGVNLSMLAGAEVQSHGGGMGGDRVHAAYFSAFDLSLVLVANGETAQLDRLARRIVRSIFDLPEPHGQTRPMPPEDRAKYTGTFNIGCSQVIIGVEDDYLFIEGVDHPRLQLRYHGQHEFIADSDPDIRVSFHIDGSGVAQSFVLDESGIQTSAVRFE